MRTCQQRKKNLDSKKWKENIFEKTSEEKERNSDFFFFLLQKVSVSFFVVVR